MRMTLISMMTVFGLVACGGDAPEAPKAHEAAAPTKTEAPKVEEKKAEKVDLAAMSDADRLAWLMKTGEVVYNTGGSGGIPCVTCHQADGKGQPGVFPPLVGSKDFMGDCKTHAGYVINGLSGKITVGGVEFDGMMPPQGQLPDEEIAAVISFERQSWGNDYGPCTVADVVAARAAK